MKGFSEILEKTVRPGQKEVQQGLSMAYQIGVDEADYLRDQEICKSWARTAGRGKGKSTKGSVAASAPEKAAADFEGNPGQKAGPGPRSEPIPAETSSASKKILFGVHDITGLPVEAQPPEGCKGSIRHSEAMMELFPSTSCVEARAFL